MLETGNIKVFPLLIRLRESVDERLIRVDFAGTGRTGCGVEDDKRITRNVIPVSILTSYYKSDFECFVVFIIYCLYFFDGNK